MRRDQRRIEEGGAPPGADGVAIVAGRVIRPAEEERSGSVPAVSGQRRPERRDCGGEVARAETIEPLERVGHGG